MKGIFAILERLIVVLGFVGNMIFLGLFVCLSYHCYGRAMFYLDGLGPFPGLSVNAFLGYLTVEALPHKAQYAVLFWIFLIVSLGSAWMSALGLRWLYHAVLRFVHFSHAMFSRG